MRCRISNTAALAGLPGVSVLDRATTVELDLSDDQADGLACIRCGERGGDMVPVGWAERPDEVLARLGVGDDARDCAISAHAECRAAGS
jgi:hypothetical protein